MAHWYGSSLSGGNWWQHASIHLSGLSRPQFLMGWGVDAAGTGEIWTVRTGRAGDQQEKPSLGSTESLPLTREVGSLDWVYNSESTSDVSLV